MKQKHHITIDATVAETVNGLASHEGRSFSNMIVRLVTEALHARKAVKTEAVDLGKGAQEIIDEVAAIAGRKGRVL